MEVFMANLDTKTTKEELRRSLTPLLQVLQIKTFEVRKKSDKTFAFLTIADIVKAQTLLEHTSKNVAFFCSPSGKQARFKVSNHAPNPHLIRVLRKEEKDSETGKPWQKPVQSIRRKQNNTKPNDNLDITAVECGRWETMDRHMTFVPYYRFNGEASVNRDGRALIVKLKTSPGMEHDIIIDFTIVQTMSISRSGDTEALTITLTLAPKIFEDNKLELVTSFLYAMDFGATDMKKPTKFRVCNLPDSTITGVCLTYRLVFRHNISNLRTQFLALTSHQIPLTKAADFQVQRPAVSFADQISQLNAEVAARKCFFCWKFQIHALWANAVLSPGEVQQTLQAMESLRGRLGDDALIQILRRLVIQLPVADADSSADMVGSRGFIAAIAEQERFMLQGDKRPDRTRDEVSVHRVTITPTGIYLYGPEEVVANRILRQYRANHDCFLNVCFADENGERVEFDRDFSNENVFQVRFLSVICRGLDVAGEHFDFLGFSHSSLRSQTCWFMRPFMHQGRQLNARDLVAQLGDFVSIRCPAKCAARIGQAFSESTSAVQVDPNNVMGISDVMVGTHTFTDGCGTMSESIWRQLRGNSSQRDQPTSYQIRYKGAKGMLTLDTRLTGSQIRLRESMIKFTGSPSNDIEICGSNTCPLPLKLNRQMIKILEDLGIAASAFEKLQSDAIENLQLSASSTESAIEFLNLHMSHSNSGFPNLLKQLQKIGIDIAEDNFLRDVLGALLQVQLREIKYRSRIPVPNGHTLYGISDETAWLDEGQVFITFASKDSGGHSHLRGTVAVTRSPALHPGDIQLAQAVTPPENSSLWDLGNCIVFSQKGERDLPSMLSGGDLDGDLYNVIFDRELIPKQAHLPAAYPPVTPVNIGRPVTADDMARFFIDFMQNDQLGRIAILHQVFADDQSTTSSQCLSLAELHSIAVDFSKSGVPVDVKQIPRNPAFRPDFMAPSASTKVEKGIRRPTDQALPEGNQRYRYYESDRVLGELYRAIDEALFFKDLEDEASSIFSTEAADTVLGEILEWVQSQINPDDFLAYLDLAGEVRDYYESTMLEIMARYTVHRNNDITEKEVFIGSIIGKSGAGSHHQREQSEYMRSRFNRDLRDIRAWMDSQTATHDEGSIYLSAACLHHAVHMMSSVDENLRSFGWFAAGMCIPALVRESQSNLGF